MAYRGQDVTMKIIFQGMSRWGRGNRAEDSGPTAPIGSLALSLGSHGTTNRDAVAQDYLVPTDSQLRHRV